MHASRLLTLVMGYWYTASAQSYQSLRCPHEESLGPWLPFERTAKTDQNPGPMGAVLKNDVHYVLVVCNPNPLGQET